MDQPSEAFMCKKEFSVYFIFTLSHKFLPFLSYDALRICFLTHLVNHTQILYMNVGIGTVAAKFLSWEYMFRIFGIVSLQCARQVIHMLDQNINRRTFYSILPHHSSLPASPLLSTCFTTLIYLLHHSYPPASPLFSSFHKPQAVWPCWSARSFL
jgi:hypothetical protein